MENNVNNHVEDKNTLYFEKLRYNNNSLSYKLGLGALVCSITAMFLALNTLDPSNALTIIAILGNILILLIGFLCCEKVKTYKINYSYIMLGLGGFCAARIFWFPLKSIIYWNKFVSDLGGSASKCYKSDYSASATKYANELGASVLGKFVADGSDATGEYGHISTAGFLVANGNVRGIVMIILLAAAATMFILSALICIKKSKDLNGYLESINAKH